MAQSHLVSRSKSPAQRLGPLQVSQSQHGLLPHIRPHAGHLVAEKWKPLPTSLQSDFLPDDVLFALTKLPLANESLGPSHRAQHIATETTVPKKRPANMWNFAKQREKFKHLTNQTPCICGVGKDISFLYDVHKSQDKNEKPDAMDESTIRQEASDTGLFKSKVVLPETLIPEEYHVVMNKGVMGLQYHEEKYNMKVEDHEKHLVMFPSMCPSTRYEVAQLRDALQDMLEKIGINDDFVELKGPTQIHNLLELMKKEQNVYNVVFHELIRQCSVECSERGELLAELRNCYSRLLSRVPLQIKGLHEEVLAQRALDRRLMEEMGNFKGAMSETTSALNEVRQHDAMISKEASETKKSLKLAMEKSSKNLHLLEEYHDLYELQRRRLEEQLNTTTVEKDMWSKAAYSLAMKVTNEASLTTAKRLHACEGTWLKLANHFTVLVSDQDTEVLADMHVQVDRFNDMLAFFDENTKTLEAAVAEGINNAINGLATMIKLFESNFLGEDGGLNKTPDANDVRQIHDEVKRWGEVLTEQTDMFSGEVLLSSQDVLNAMRKQIEGWSNCAIKVFSRHSNSSSDQLSFQRELSEMADRIEELFAQCQIRLSGENGVAKGLINMINTLESLESKLATAVLGKTTLPDAQWMNLYQLLPDWRQHLEETAELIGGIVRRDTAMAIEAATEAESVLPIDYLEISETAKKWLARSTSEIDSVDATLINSVSTLHTDMVKWMVHMLLHLAQTTTALSPEAKHSLDLDMMSPENLELEAESLFTQVTRFTLQTQRCCHDIVMDKRQKAQELNLPDADRESHDLDTFVSEAKGWVQQAKMLLESLLGKVLPEGLESEMNIRLQSALNIEPSRSGMLDSSYTSTASINVMNGQATLSDIAEDKQSESDVTQAAALIKETVVVTDPTSTVRGDSVLQVQVRVPVGVDGPTDHQVSAGQSEAGTSAEPINNLPARHTDSVEPAVLVTQTDQVQESALPGDGALPDVTISNDPHIDTAHPEVATASTDMPLFIVQTGTVTDDGSGTGANSPRLGIGIVVPGASQSDVTNLACSDEDRADVEQTVVGVDAFQVLAYDCNTYMQPLLTDTVETEAASRVPRPYSAQTTRAFEALVALNNMQQQLVEVEGRAQRSDERVAVVQADLGAAQHRIRELERLLELSGPGGGGSPAGGSSQVGGGSPAGGSQAGGSSAPASEPDRSESAADAHLLGEHGSQTGRLDRKSSRAGGKTKAALKQKRKTTKQGLAPSEKD